MSEVWRVFAAIDLTPEIRERILDTARLLEDAGWRAKWVREEQMHMTVRFYGDLEVPSVERLQETLRPALAARPAFELLVNRVGAFPAPSRPRVIWLGISDPFEQLPGLKDIVEEATEAAGISTEPGPYKPHLTVGRLAPDFRIHGDEAVATFQEFGRYEPISFIPESVKLIRSKLGRGGAQHTLIEEFAFGPADGTVSDSTPETEAERSVETAGIQADSSGDKRDSDREP